MFRRLKGQKVTESIPAPEEALVVEENEDEEQKPSRLKGVVSSPTTVTRDDEGGVKVAWVMVKVPFKGEVKVIMQGALAGAYWSITPDMAISFVARQMADKEYLAESLEVVPAV